MTPATAPIGTAALVVFGAIAAAVLGSLWVIDWWIKRRKKARRMKRRLEE
jgi:hypothetical protein